MTQKPKQDALEFLEGIKPIFQESELSKFELYMRASEVTNQWKALLEARNDFADEFGLEDI